MSEFVLYTLLIIAILLSLDFILPLFYDIDLSENSVLIKVFGITVAKFGKEKIIYIGKKFIFEAIFLNPFATLGVINRPRKLIIPLLIEVDTKLIKYLICTPRDYD